MILAFAVIVGLGVALLRGGSLLRLGEQPLRLGWVAVTCFLAQAYVSTTPADQIEGQRTLHAVLLMGSQAALLAVVWANIRATGVVIIGLGLLLNLSVMALNGGFMPISRDVLMRVSSGHEAGMLQEGARIPRTKNVVLRVQDTKLSPLSDVIVGPTLPMTKVYSFGDLVVALGAFVFLQSAMSTRKERGAPVLRAPGQA